MTKRDEMIDKVEDFIRRSSSRIETALANLEKGGSAVAGMSYHRKADDYKLCLAALANGQQQLMSKFGHSAVESSNKAAPAA